MAATKAASRTRSQQRSSRTARTTSAQRTTPGFYASPVAHSSVTDEWATPQHTFDELQKQFGFGLDVCALQSSAKCDIWYGPDHPDVAKRDGLVQDWTVDAKDSAVWMNPPYGSTIGDWMNKAVRESDKGATVVCLIPARTDTRWFQDTVLRLHEQGRAEMTFVRGRLKFGTAKNAAPFPSVIAVLRPTPAAPAQQVA